MSRFVRTLSVAVFVLAIAAPAFAAGTLAPLFTVPGVVNTGTLGTYFACTNTDAVPVTVGVEVFGQGGSSGNNPLTTAISLGPQATVMFGTQIANGLSVDAALNPGFITKGLAHILTTSKKVACSAYLADSSGNPPISMTTLTIAAKGKQKGD
jgi:hypothetical protein